MKIAYNCFFNKITNINFKIKPPPNENITGSKIDTKISLDMRN